MRTISGDASKGFTLIEVIFSVVVLSIGLVTLIQVMTHVLNRFSMTEALNMGTSLAERELERVANLRYSNVVNAGPTFYASPFQNYTYQVSVTAVPVALANDLGMAQYKQVTVTIHHTMKGDVSLTTIVTNKYS